MTRGTVLITTPRLAGRAHAMLEGADYLPVYVPDGTQSADMVAFARATQSEHGAVIAIVSRTLRIGDDTFAELPDLRIISKHGAGVDNIDVEAARARGISVVRASGSNARSVAEHALALMFAAARYLVPLANSTANGEWNRTRWLGEQLSDKTLGVVGFGQIGRELVQMGQAVCGRVIVADPYANADAVRALGAEVVTLATLQTEADIVSLHCPLNDETRNMIDADFLAGMRPGAYLINTARGEIVDEAAVLDALNAGQLAGVSLDSLLDEGEGKTALRSHPNALVTPHIGGSTKQALMIVAERAVSNVIDFLDGKPLRPGDVIG